MTDQQMAEKIAMQVARLGGRAYYVGGCVRDGLSGRQSKDLDVEVHGLEPSQLQSILDGLGERMTIGESFGIYGLKGYDLDIAMPRKETARGSGHRDFDIFVDPFAGTESAARRRDFTINAMMQDVMTGEIIDHFGGKDDLHRGVLRHVSNETFAEDPLRVLRAAQFAARFEFQVAPETIALCQKMELQHLPRERVEAELKKALLKAEKPSSFFEVLRQMDGLDIWFPEVKALIGVEQNPRYHAEGDVWTHTMMVLDAAAKYRDKAEDPLGLMLAALTHDLGKAVCTERIDGVIHAYEHETAGLPLVETLLHRLTGEKKLHRLVLNLVKLHMKPNTAAAMGSSVKATNKMFDSAMAPEALICLALADAEGRITQTPQPSHEAFLRKRLDLYRQQMEKPYIAGKDLVEAGLTPDENFSELLQYAHKLRLAGVEKESALKQVLAYARKRT